LPISLSISSICGTPNYLAPEVFLREGHSKAADCWAAGATLYFMLCARAPFQPADPIGDGNTGFLCMDSLSRGSSVPTTPSTPSVQPVGSQVRSICRCLLLGRYEFPTSVSQPARQVIQKLLQRAPTSRPTASEVLRMEFCLRQSESSRLNESDVNIDLSAWISLLIPQLEDILYFGNACASVGLPVYTPMLCLLTGPQIDYVFESTNYFEVFILRINLPATAERIQEHLEAFSSCV
uniref:Protein kinase domain-containing protein n=1 Tax=Echinostoma caproni TaxID=27848 RepID=A0A183BAS4_9TREM